MHIFTDHKTTLQEGTVPNYSWAPKYAQPQSEPPDYQHNVYIPGTASNYSTLKLSPRGELDVYNTFSTFGKKKKFISHYEQSFGREDGLISNAIFKWCTRLYCVMWVLCWWLFPVSIHIYAYGLLVDCPWRLTDYVSIFFFAVEFNATP